jgi:hypothetical protein
VTPGLLGHHQVPTNQGHNAQDLSGEEAFKTCFLGLQVLVDVPGKIGTVWHAATTKQTNCLLFFGQIPIPTENKERGLLPALESRLSSCSCILWEMVLIKQDV